jgi:hypothetical protein
MAVLRESQTQLHRLLNKTHNSVGEATLAGDLYDAIGPSIIEAGGTFPIRRLGNSPAKGVVEISSNNGFQVTIRLDEDEKVTASTTSSSASSAVSFSPSLVATAPATILLTQDLSASKKRKLDSGSASSAVSSSSTSSSSSSPSSSRVPATFVFGAASEIGDIPAAALAIPSFRNLVAADLFVKQDSVAFQLTVSGSHPIKHTGFVKAIGKWMKAPIRFIFVVPSQAMFDTYELQPYAFTPKKHCPHCTTKQERKGQCTSCAVQDLNMTQYVMRADISALYVDPSADAFQASS